MSGVNIPFNLDPDGFERGIRQVEESVDDVASAFEVVETAAQEAGQGVDEAFDKVGDDAFDGVARQADSEFDRVETSARESLRDVSSWFADAGDDAFDGMARQADTEFDRIETSARSSADRVDDAFTGSIGRGRFGGVGAELGEELSEGFTEGIQSGNPADALLSVLRGLGPALGLAGIGVGVVAAIFKGMREKAQEEVARVGQIANDLFQDVTGAELGGRRAAEAYWQGFVEAADVPGRLEQILNVDGPVATAQRLQQIITDTGLSIDTVTQALLGQPAAIGRVATAQAVANNLFQEATDYATTKRAIDAGTEVTLRNQTGVLRTQKDALAQLLGLSNQTAQGTRDAAAAQRLLRDATQAAAGHAGRLKGNMAGVDPPNLAAMADDTKSSASDSGRLKGNMNATDPPNMGPMSNELGNSAARAGALRDNLRGAESHASGVRREIENIPRSVTVNVTNKLRTIPMD